MTERNEKRPGAGSRWLAHHHGRVIGPVLARTAEYARVEFENVYGVRPAQVYNERDGLPREGSNR